MAEASMTDSTSRSYQLTVTVIGMALWVMAAASQCVGYAAATGRDHWVLLALVPVVVLVGMFPITFPLPSGLTSSKINFTLSDAFILLIACLYGALPAILVAGIEGFTSSRRLVRRLPSNLFSSAMMSLATAIAATSLKAVLRYDSGAATGALHNHNFSTVAVALLVAGIAQVLVNWLLLSTLLAMRQGNPILHEWKANFFCAAPIFLPTSAAASLMYLALQYNALLMGVIGAPIMIAIYFGHRQYRDGVHERIAVMEKSHRETIEALAVAINAKDEVTHEHVLRVQLYAAGVARILGCDEAEVEALKAGSLLHDIGKIAVPDFILNKPGKLTADEFEKMKTHTLVGAQILGRVDFPYPVVPIVRHHHERWDGRGYPDGLKGEEIPLTARIISVVDCFDAVREDRQYRKAMTREEAVEFIMSGSGTMYDPRVVGTFLTHLPEFEAEIQAHRGTPTQTFGIEPVEQLSLAARAVVPAAGLAVEIVADADKKDQPEFSHQELKSLYELAQKLNDTRGQNEICGAFTEKLKAIVPFDSCAVTLAQTATGGYAVAYAAGEHAARLEHRKVAMGEGVTGWTIANSKPFCNTDPKLDLPPALAEAFAAYRTLAAFPLITGAELIGAVTLYSATLPAYTIEHQRLLKEASQMFATVLSNEIRMHAPSTEMPVNISHETIQVSLLSETLQ